MTLSLAELITRYGDDVQFQNLDHCVNDMQLSKKGTLARFGTSEAFDLKGFKKLGLIVWLDRAEVDAIVAKSKETTGEDHGQKTSEGNGSAADQKGTDKSARE